MEDLTKQKILAAIDGASEEEFYIKDAFGDKLKIYNTPYLDDAPFDPPLTVYVWNKQLQDWQSFKMARLKDLFTDPLAGILQANLRME